MQIPSRLGSRTPSRMAANCSNRQPGQCLALPCFEQRPHLQLTHFIMDLVKRPDDAFQSDHFTGRGEGAGVHHHEGDAKVFGP